MGDFCVAGGDKKRSIGTRCVLIGGMVPGRVGRRAATNTVQAGVTKNVSGWSIESLDLFPFVPIVVWL